MSYNQDFNDETEIKEGSSKPNALRVLTPRQREIARLVARGKTNLQIGVALEITEKTVKFHMGHIFKRLGVKTRTQLTILVLSSKRGDLEGAKAYNKPDHKSIKCPIIK